MLILPTGRGNGFDVISIHKPVGLITFGDAIMTDTNEQPRRKLWSARRLTLLCSAAVLGSALVAGGPIGYGRLAGSAFAATPAPITANAQGAPGFADLVAKVKPAV